MLLHRTTSLVVHVCDGMGTELHEG
jgi:hypothetical protein